MNISMLADYIWNGNSFANNEYSSTQSIGKELTGSEISRIRSVWKEIEFYLIATSAVCISVGCVVTPSAFMASPLLGAALALGLIVLSTSALMRVIDVRAERRSWDVVEPGQDYRTRADAMIQKHNEDIQKCRQAQQTCAQIKESLDAYR
jgi:hypothetical protein